jgi:hypothetical protein
MAEHMLKMVGLSKDRVQALLYGGEAKRPKSPSNYEHTSGLKRHDRAAKAYEMVKAGAVVATACQSWGVRIAEVDQFAKTNGQPLVGTFHARSESKSRVGYELAIKVGMQKAVKDAGVTREAIYAYARRYRLPPPERAKFV